MSARPSSTWALVWSSLRPGQWTKNLLLFVGLIFGGRLLDPDAVAAAVVAFAVFCVLSGAGYLFNDVWDRGADRRHPLKQARPIASGELSPATATVAAAFLAGAGLAAAALIAPALARRLEHHTPELPRQRPSN